MRIEGHHPAIEFHRVAWAQGAGATKPTKRVGSRPGSPDVLELSPMGPRYQIVRRLVEGAPEFRQKRVDEIKRAIDSGTYDVRGELVAAKMIRESLIDLLVCPIVVCPRAHHVGPVRPRGGRPPA